MNRAKHMFFLFVLASCIAAQGQTDSTARMLTVIKGKYKIQYPSHWSLDTSGLMGSDLFVLAPRENEKDNFSENVNIIVQDLAGVASTLAQYKEVSDKEIRQMGPAVQVVESKVVKTAGKEYFSMIYFMTQNGLKLKIHSVCFIRQTKGYLLTFTAEISQFDKYRKAGEAILNSFTFNK